MEKLNGFWIRVISLLIIAASLTGYNTVLESRAKDEEIAKLSAQLAGSPQAEDASADGSYQDGTYTGEAEGFGGTITVEVNVQEGRITEVAVLSAEGEDGAYLSMAKDVIPKIIEAQSTEVDSISGATFSSSGIINASANALEKAVE